MKAKYGNIKLDKTREIASFEKNNDSAMI